MRIYLSLILFIAFSVSSMGQHRSGDQNFDFDWQFARFGLQADGSRLSEPADAASPAFDSRSWRKLDLPHDWAIEGPWRNDLEGSTGKLPWQGIGWYRKHFSAAGFDPARRYYLDFDGAMAHAEVWLNGHRVGGRPYGYSSFRVDLTPFLRRDGDNVVAVRLDTEHWGSRWYPGAGIYRHVRLVSTPQVHVSYNGAFVTTPVVNDRRAEVRVELAVENHLSKAVQAEWQVELYELSPADKPGRRVARTSRNAFIVAPADTARLTLPAIAVKHPKLWNLESPHRYLARITVYRDGQPADVYTQPFGIRTIAFTHDNGFLLNGRRVPLNGVCMHHDLGALGAAMHTSALRRQLRILQSFGCNAIRTSHNMPAPELLDLADKMGMLVMNETFDCWRHGKKPHDYATLYDEWHERDIRDFILRDRNHPSVILWSVGNEVHEQYYPKTGEAQHLRDVVHRYDTTRPATFGASAPNVSAVNGTELQMDVHGMNYPSGVYGSKHFLREFLDMPGHENLSGYISESASTLSTRGEYFPRPHHVSSYDTREPGWGGLPEWEWENLDRAPGICGEFVWTGFDYIGEPTPFNSDAAELLNFTAGMDSAQLAEEKRKLEEKARRRPPSRSSYFGIVDLAGFPKDRYYYYQSRWMADLPMAHLVPAHWNFPDRAGKKTPVYVYTSGDEAELFLNGRSLGRKRKGEYEYRLKWDSVVYEPGELRTVAYRDGKQWSADTVCTTGEAVRMVLRADKTTLRADGDDLVFVEISFVDAEGREVATAEPTVTCSADGCGRVVATDNGDPTCHIVFSSPVRPAFNGRLLAIVKAERGRHGAVRFRAEAPGMPAAELTLTVPRK